MRKLPFGRRLLAVLLIALFPVLFLAVTGSLAVRVSAHAPPQKAGKSAPAKKPGKKLPKEEEDDTAAPTTNKPPLRLPDDDASHNRARQPGAESESGQAISLRDEAKLASDPEEKKLFEKLAVPYDEVVLKEGGQRNARPVPIYVGSDPHFTGTIEIHFYDGKFRPKGKRKVSAQGIDHIKSYEEMALAAVDKFLKKDADQPINDPAKAAKKRVARLRAAEKALQAVVQWHERARGIGLREQTGWDNVRDQLKARLFAVRMDQVQVLDGDKQFDAAVDLGRRLADDYPDKKEAQLAFLNELEHQAQQSLRTEDYRRTYLRLKRLDEKFPESAEAKPIREALQTRAAALFSQAKDFYDNKKDPAKAQEFLDQAENIWPNLEGLFEYRSRVGKEYPILYVGVRQLPENLSPASAASDVEFQAVELQFESLLKSSYQEGAGQRYELGLAAGRPQTILLGRRFRLAPDAVWSNQKPVTAADVNFTVQRLIQRSRLDVIDRAEPGPNSHIVDVMLKHGFLDPLSLMTFKIVPDSSDDKPESKFSKNPVGSGPFLYDRRDADHAVFIANPYYRRAGKEGLPYIKEIHFYRWQIPVHDFSARHFDMILDLPTAEIRNVANLEGVKVFTMRTRRIYFLAANHRRPGPDNLALRKALANVIEREKVLNDFFRAGRKDVHRALNGPYPPDSWAYNPNVVPFAPKVAPNYAQEAKNTLTAETPLTLKYPNDDRRVKAACEYIRDQVHQLGFELELMPVSPQQLHRDVEETHQYDFAYYHWDYPTEDYWLWPLFNPSQEAMDHGHNFLGYANDSNLQQTLQKAMLHRDFHTVQQFCHDIHAIIHEKVPFIPLWQLDMHIAYRADFLKPVHLDPLRIFTDVEQWKLEKH